MNGNGKKDLSNTLNNIKTGTSFAILKSLTRFKACGKGCIGSNNNDNKVSISTAANNKNNGGNQSENNNQAKQKKKKRRMEDGKLNPKTVEMLRKKTKFSK